MEVINTILKVGSVTSVRGRLVEVKVDTTKNTSHILFKGEALKNVSVGSFVKIAKGFTEIIGKIDGEYITEEKLLVDKVYTAQKERIKRILNISLLGFIDGNKFKQGIKELPLIDNECYILTQAEFNLVHKFVQEGEDTIILGSLSHEKGKEIEVGVNNLFASHIGIFGNTGSGKSYTLAKIYHELLKKYKTQEKFLKNARFMLIDFNGEYVHPQPGTKDNIIIEEEFKDIYELSTDKKGSKKKFPVKGNTLYDATFWAILLTAAEKTQAPFLASVFKNEYLNANIKTGNGVRRLLKSTLKLITTQVTINQEKNLVDNFLSEIMKFDCDKVLQGISDLQKDYSNNLKFFSDKSRRGFYYKDDLNSYDADRDLNEFVNEVIDRKVDEIDVDIDNFNDLQKIKLLITFHYFYCIQKGQYNKEHIGPLIGRLDAKVHDINKVFEIENEINPTKLLSIVSLRNVNITMKKVIPLVICKQHYEDKKELNKKNTFLNIIIDEAHNILSYNSERESETWKDYRLETFEEIIKEGRKFGVFLTIASQRPFDISSTIISQLHNYFLHRLINNRDIEAVEKTISYLDRLSFESLPILPQGTCILAGLSAQIPIVLEIFKIEEEYRPFNETMILTKYWND